MTETNQPALIEQPPTKKRRKIGKTRSDKGKKRKPDPTENERRLAEFAKLDRAGKEQFIADHQRFIDDCGLILRFCDPAFVKTFNEYVPPHANQKGPEEQ